MKRTILLLLLVLALSLVGPVLAQSADFTLSPSEINIGTLYNGATLAVQGSVPEGSQVVVRFIGSPEEMVMKQKGKALGLLWMNMNTLHFSGVPTVCLVDSSAPLDGLGALGASLSLDGLAQGIHVAPSSPADQDLVAEMLKLKRSEGLYRQSSGGVTLGQVQDGQQAFQLALAVPSRLSAGTYSVEVLAMKDGQVAARAVKPVEAHLTGIPSFLADLAFNHAIWYGVLSAILAILGGLAIGLVFQSKEAH